MKMKECINSNKTILSNRDYIIVIYSALKIHSHLTGFLIIQFGDSGIHYPINAIAHRQNTGTMGRNDAGFPMTAADDIPKDLPFRSYVQCGGGFIQ